MRNEEISKLLLRRFAVAQHPVGRMLLNLHVLLQRLRSQWRAHGTDIIKRASDMRWLQLAVFAQLVDKSSPLPSPLDLAPASWTAAVFLPLLGVIF